MKKCVIFLLMAVLLLSMAGCGPRSEADAISHIEQQLNESYDSVFKVTKIEYDARQREYTAQVTQLNSYLFFTAVCAANGTVTHNYETISRQTALEQTLNALLAEYPCFQLDSLNMNFNGSPGYLTQVSRMPDDPKNPELDFSSLQDIDIKATLVISQEDPVDVAEDLFRLYRQIDTRNIPLDLTLVHSYNGMRCATKVKFARQENLELIRGTLYGLTLQRQTRQMLLQILEPYSFLTVERVSFDPSFGFGMDFDTAVNGMELAEFLNEARLSATIDLILPDPDPETRVQEVWELHQALNASGVSCTLEISASAEKEYPKAYIRPGDDTLEEITRELQRLHKE